MPQIHTTKSRLEVVPWEVMPFAFIEMSGWKVIVLFDIQIMSSDIQIISQRKQDQLLQLIFKSWHKPINKMDYKEIGIAVTETKKNNLTTACKPLNLCHIRPLWIVEYNTCFSRWKYLNTAVDSDVGYNDAEFNSVCCTCSQSLEKIVIQYW